MADDGRTTDPVPVPGGRSVHACSNRNAEYGTGTVQCIPMLDDTVRYHSVPIYSIYRYGGICQTCCADAGIKPYRFTSGVVCRLMSSDVRHGLSKEACAARMVEAVALQAESLCATAHYNSVRPSSDERVQGGWETVRVLVSRESDECEDECAVLDAVVWPELRARCAALKLHLLVVDTRQGVSCDMIAPDACLLQVEATAQADAGTPFVLAVHGTPGRGWRPPPEELTSFGEHWVHGLSLGLMEIFDAVCKRSSPSVLLLSRKVALASGASAAEHLAPSKISTALLRSKLLEAQHSAVATYVRELLSSRLPAPQLVTYHAAEVAAAGTGSFSSLAIDGLWELIRQRYRPEQQGGAHTRSRARWAAEMARKAVAMRLARGPVLARAIELVRLQQMVCGLVGLSPTVSEHSEPRVPLLLYAPPGTGKSRLVDALCDRLRVDAPQLRVVRHQASAAGGVAGLARVALTVLVLELLHLQATDAATEGETTADSAVDAVEQLPVLYTSLCAMCRELLLHVNLGPLLIIWDGIEQLTSPLEGGR